MLPSFRSRFLPVLFWLVISAAFIGPGTVTTAAAAGASFHVSLLWALTFATGACILLQEAAARITIASGRTLGEALAHHYPAARWGVAGAILFGCAAYQAGNLLGAVAGLRLIVGWPAPVLTLGVGLVCGAVLWFGRDQAIARFLGALVGIMGLGFLLIVFTLPLAWGEVAAASVVPRFPDGAGLLILGLLGTTVVPYNLFLGSGISHGQTLRQMRGGLIAAVLIGGLISAAILLIGTQIRGAFSFEALATALQERTGAWARVGLGIGLFAAGFTSSVTAPLASALTLQSVVGPHWTNQSWAYRLTWGGVLGFGLLFGFLDVKPIPAIILAQGLNGILLPLMTILLLLIVNHPAAMPRSARNGPLLNALMLLLVGVSTLLGVNNLTKAVASAVGITSLEGTLPYVGAVAILVTGVLGWRIRKL
ncbi:NRAMP (natural resistance-associated macrophage protein) metal ion transporters [Catalinimonas alkaloidigena]|uniref:NRAMP (Natural resistance-associated macrophage protein) metal ion transporters n=1 Tax=Catalinimonas alkaloidigena TaxID=1075417 RepID=A0A1G9R7V0_9BACT|nr:divalent metal cation transporter [Catalinimonas alkaloidigena]SDM19318.1 NRAMP (natural resistance-associated macrophage protein) metal ion transporters [Catalinimonas alkaloidigena]